MTPPDQPVAPPDISPKRLRVLLADNTPQVLLDLQQLLELSGEIEIIGAATNGQEAIQLAEQFRPEVVVMDLDMPVLDGYEATRQIKTRKLAGRVVILSIYGGANEQARARECGADEFVVKGTPYESLVAAIIGRKP